MNNYLAENRQRMVIFMNQDKVNAEILGVLMGLGIDYINKLPESLMDYLTKNCDKERIPQIDRNKSIEKQPISREARSFIIMLKLQYWCNSIEEREEIIKKLKENELKS